MGEDLQSAYGLGLEQNVNRLVDYNPIWPQAFAVEADRIRAAVGSLAVAVEHYGSTSVPGLRAKPIIDILIGVTAIDHGIAMIEPMARLGYDYAGNQGIPEHHIFGRGKARTYLAHVVVFNGDQWRQALHFRDRLRADPDLRQDYEGLKEQLAGGTLTRAAYTAGKSDFILQHGR